MSRALALIESSLFWVLPLLGAHTLWVSSAQNGFFAALEEAITQRELPGSPNAMLRTRFTGIQSIDRALELFVIFYWPVANGNSLALSLLAIPLASTLGVAYVLIVLEASRWQPLARVICRSALVLTLVMLVGPAIILPLYCALDLASNSRIRQSTARAPLHSPIWCLPVCLVAGYYLVVLVVSLPSPAVATDHFKQGMIIVLQGWPLWVTALVWLLSHTLEGQGLRTGLRQDRSTAYMFAICAAAIPYLAVVVIACLPSSYCHSCGGDASISSMFLNALFSLDTDLSLEEGLQRFLLWDFVIGSMAVLLWAIGLSLDMDGGKSNGLCLLGKAVVLSASLSPCGAAALMLWQRDRDLMRVKGSC
ncbi:uncharacterized protein BDW70DRAFT_164967 [Aspergillus foveolatus]|uniref:uncharacterized protein n=1 Tax=Aspergillus foveolatus TaxID=210207 RepID=UPI003CCE02D6